MPTARRLRLGAFMRPVSIHTGSWRWPAAWPDANFNCQHLKRLIQTLEAACFDAFFMAEHLAVRNMPMALVHSVLWPLALATYSGFQGVPEVLRMAGRNYGLTGLRYVLQILVPSALPAILSGLRIAWAFAWRTLIAAELVFGASSGQGGLGWYVFQNRNELYTDRVFAGLACVILIGLVVENGVFNTLERLTVRRWGVQR
jgi:NitT/TauT family transport system permease protein